MVHDGHVRKLGLPGWHIEVRADCIEVERLHPGASRSSVRKPVLRTNSSDPLAIHAVFDNQQTTRLRHQGRQHAFNRSGTGRRHQHGTPFDRVKRISRQKPHAGFILQVKKLAFAMTQVRLRQTSAHTFRQRDGPGIEQEHHRMLAAGAKCCIKRVLTSTGLMDGRGRSSDRDARVSKRANLDPSSGGASSHAATCARSSVSSAEA